MARSQVVLRLRYRKGDCPTCDITVEYHKFVKPYTRVAERLAQYIADACRLMPLTQVAAHVHLSHHFGYVVLSDLQLLCIDEISLKKHYHYLTVLANYETGTIVAAMVDWIA